MKEDKRKDYFSWDETFMQMCKVIAQRSKDPNTQTGACIVNDSNIIIGLGYNGFPRGCSDDNLSWAREGDFQDTKYPYVVHSEENAVLNSNASTEGARMYATLFPCNECVKVIIQKGIKEIIYEDDKYHDDEKWVASRKMLDLAGVKYRQYTPSKKLTFE
ncbi:cytidine and deoxycytidylate deaminase zinc-binding region [bacterium BMS3Abin15]|nr:cytidine and deoxycytidylate deaminase zinc-binding region [bacterium BMS3Abin15]HDH07737.1 dCMP deaminase family protein [Candidatus Moranbacteria bacterium]HDZ85074.1 dCMP deaminase family protein [Candidatus Moranbacteria bacterium]